MTENDKPWLQRWYTVQGRVSGTPNHSTEEVVSNDRFTLRCESRELALDLAKHICAKLQPCGQVSVWCEDPHGTDLEAEFIGLVSRRDDGDWWVNPEGLDLRN